MSGAGVPQQANPRYSGVEAGSRGRELAQRLQLRPVSTFSETRIEDVIGSVWYVGAQRSLVDMRNAVPPGYADDP